MKTGMRCIASGMVLVLAFSSFAAAAAFPLYPAWPELSAPAPPRSLTRSQAALAPIISAGLIGLSFTEGLLLDSSSSETQYAVYSGTIISAHLPMYFVDWQQGLLFSGLTGLTLAADHYYGENKGDPFFNSFIGSYPLEVNLYSTYAMYATTRPRVAPSEYNQNWRKSGLRTLIDQVFPCKHNDGTWRPYNLGELLLAPVSWDNLSDFFVWYPGLVGLLVPMIAGDHDKAIWSTGKAYIGRQQMAPGLAIPLMALFFFLESTIIGVTEEAHFRGFIYEEIGSGAGHWWAKAVDMIYFPAVHVPGEMSTDLTGGEIALNFLRRSLLTFFIDISYDRGGLRRSVAMHTWIDFSLLFSYWLLKAGEPQESLQDILGMCAIPGVQFSFPF